jgi:hypothetical protein
MCSRDEAPESGCRQNVHFFIVLPNNARDYVAATVDSVSRKARLAADVDRFVRRSSVGQGGKDSMDIDIATAAVIGNAKTKIATRTTVVLAFDTKQKSAEFAQQAYKPSCLVSRQDASFPKGTIP